MTRSRLNWLSTVLLGGLFLSACGSERSDQVLEFQALGTEVSVSLYAVTANEADETSLQLRQYMAGIGHDWYPWSEGELRSINIAIELQEAVDVSPRLATVIQRAAQIERLSDNYFNAGLGRVTELWGLHQIGSEPPPIPTSSEIARALSQAIGVSNIRWTGDRIVGAPPGLMLDLGGIAKGAILEDSRIILRGLEIDNAIINIGGDLTVIGDVDGRAAHIGIRSPVEESAIASVDIVGGETIVTSGNYERYVEIDGVRYSHVLNPRTGLPVSHTNSVTVIHIDPILADAAATALMVGGAENFEQLTEALGIEYALLISASGELSLTTAMDNRLNWLN
ncbi:MAG: FAD:protein FMN transferase [Woeseiaceae bacterium]